jgi:metal-dependent hydrolase (beta-lactamase superfamily II)
LHIQPRKGLETRRYLLDFGFTPGVYTDNLEILKIDVAQVDPLIISPGHYDHIGGLMGIPGDSARLGCAEICACTSPGKTVSAIAISATWMAALPKSAPRWIDVGCEP